MPSTSVILARLLFGNAATKRLKTVATRGAQVQLVISGCGMDSVGVSMASGWGCLGLSWCIMTSLGAAWPQ